MYTCEYYGGALLVRLLAYHSIQRLVPPQLSSGHSNEPVTVHAQCVNSVPTPLHWSHNMVLYSASTHVLIQVRRYR